jgi:hypothetical protein
MSPDRLSLQTIPKNIQTGMKNPSGITSKAPAPQPQSPIPRSSFFGDWRSFSYYTYHPLPQQQREIDFNAFKRAAILLVFQCDDLIGTQELAMDWRWIWRNDGPLQLFRTARFEDSSEA